MRQPRQLRAGARYHVTARVNNREFLICSDRAKNLFEQVLAKAKKRYIFSIENFVVMDNHIHLIVHPQNGESLSRIMQWIMSVYAMAINKLLGRSGHFWGSRFFSRILFSLSDFLATFLYIDNNPVEAGVIGSDAYWPFSGLYHRRYGNTRIISRLSSYLEMSIRSPSPLLLTYIP